MKLKITTLIENNPDDMKEFMNEHGLSLYIEANRTKILFDTGQTGDFIENAKKLNEDLSNLEYIIISHGHYDHSGGLRKLVSMLNKYPKLIVGEEFFEPKYKKTVNQTYKYIGNPFDYEYLLSHNIFTEKIKDDVFYLTDSIMVFHHFPKGNDFEKRNENFYVKKNKVYVHDDFEDEIVLGISISKGVVVIVGCSHVGIVNILKTIMKKTDLPIYAVIGGTHLIEADEIRIQKTIEELRKMNLEFIGVSHCTGEESIKKIQEELGDKFLYNNTGNVILISSGEE